MIWKKYSIKTTTADCEMICATLMDYGITDVQIENNIQLTDEEMNRMYADFVKELPEDDGSCTVSFYLDEKGFIPEGIGTGDSPASANESEGYEGIYVDMNEVRQGLADAHELFGIAPVTIEESEAHPEDWNNKWKEYFKPFTVGNVMIKPTWEDQPDTSPEIVINMDPGMAFGTGTHETTRLCLMALQKYIKGADQVLDLGCGSGILGIAALKLGASYVTAVDIDPQAVSIAEENFLMNVQPEQKTDAFELYTANIMQDEKLCSRLESRKYDIVLANILAEVIVPLSSVVHRFLKEGGIFIASGIIDYKEEEVIRAINLSHELELKMVETDGDWRAVTAVKKTSH